MQHDSTCNRAFLSQQRVDVFNNCHISVSWAANYTFVPAWADGPYDSSSQIKLPVSVSFLVLDFAVLGWTSFPGEEPLVGIMQNARCPMFLFITDQRALLRKD